MTELERLRAQNAEMKALLRAAEQKLRKANFEAKLWRRLQEREVESKERESQRPLRAYFGISSISEIERNVQ